MNENEAARTAELSTPCDRHYYAIDGTCQRCGKPSSEELSAAREGGLVTWALTWRAIGMGAIALIVAAIWVSDEAGYLAAALTFGVALGTSTLVGATVLRERRLRSAKQ